MEQILQTIKKEKLIKPGDVVGVATSGGSDSMALLHFLFTHKQELDIDVCAVHIDHALRENSAEDANFVMDYCKNNGIRAYKFRVDVPKLMEQKKMSVEAAAREARFGVFEALHRKNVVDKIAIAHNQKDQAETILLNLFRGTGLSGAGGMEFERGGLYIRPMLSTTKTNIMNYIFLNDIPYVTDQTNADNAFSRNFIRNQILPLVEERWPGVVEKLVNFGKDCAENDEYISSLVMDDAVIYEEKTAMVPTSYFLYPNPVVSKMLFKVLGKIGITKDIERVHIDLIKSLAKNGLNGKKLKLPNKLTVWKEYDYVTLTNKQKQKQEFSAKWGLGETVVPNFGSIIVRRTQKLAIKENQLVLDANKVPKDAIWRFRERGDTFTKFGGGTKKLKDFLIDKKIPSRIRETLPVLASGNEILAVAGVEIAQSVQVDDKTKTMYKIITKKC